MVRHQAEQPVQYHGFVLETVHNAVHGFREHFRIVDFNLKVGCQTQLMSQTTKDGLEERVDGANAEMAIVMEYLVQSLATAAANLGFFGGGVGFFLQRLDEFIVVILAGRQRVGDAIEVSDDSVLHLTRGLVGEGHRQNMAMLTTVSCEDQ